MRRPDGARAACAAYRVLAGMAVEQLPVDPLALLCRCRNTRVFTYEEAAEVTGLAQEFFERQFADADAFTLRQQANGEDAYITVYRTDGNPARRRFTLAHELGHRVLRHDGHGAIEEQEADCFASHLLCPCPALELLEDRFGELRPEYLAAVFYVSLGCARQLSDRRTDGVSTELLEKVRSNLQGSIPDQLPPPIRMVNR